MDGINMKEIWKWIFNQHSERELSELCLRYQLQIPGFRKGTIPKNFKSMVISQLLNKRVLDKLIKDPIILSKSFEEKYAFDEMSSKELSEITDIPPSRILIRILSQGATEKAIDTFYLFRGKYKEELEKIDFDLRLKLNSTQERGSDSPFERENEDKSKMVKFEKIQKKLEQKIQTLLEELENTQKELKSTKEQLTRKQREYSIEIQKLKQKNVAAEQQLETMQTHLSECEIDLINYEILKNSWEIDKEDLLQKIKEFEYKGSENHEKNQILQPHITIIGDPQNKSVFKKCCFSYSVIAKENIEEMDWNNCEEIWILSYKINYKIIEEIKRYTNIPIIVMNTFTELKETIKKRNEFNEQSFMEF